MLHGWAWDTVVSEPWLRAARLLHSVERLFKARVLPAGHQTTPASRTTRTCHAITEDAATDISVGGVAQATQCHNVQPRSDRPIQLQINHHLPCPAIATNSKPLPSPVSTKVLHHVLQGYDNILLDYLIHGFAFVFRLGCSGKQISNKFEVHFVFPRYCRC